jgi:hypothetical protein
MNGGSVHFVMGASHARVALFASIRFLGFLRIEGMGSMAAVAFVLNVVTALTKSLSQGIWKGLVLTMLFHAVPGYGMPPFLKLFKLFRMALGANLGLHRRFPGPGFFMAFVTGNAIHPTFVMFAIHPGLENSRSVLLVAGQAVADLFLRRQLTGRRKKKEES